MNPIAMAISNVGFVIPREILREVFKPPTLNYTSFMHTAKPVNYEEQIEYQVIRPRVLKQTNLMGGQELVINLDNIPVEYVDPNRLLKVFRVPKHMTQGRTITSILSLSYAAMGALSSLNNTANFDPCTVTDMNMAIMAMNNSMSSIPVPSNALVTLIGENTVMIKDSTLGAGQGMLRCVVEMDDNLANLHPRNFTAFFKLTEYAVKSFIYNQFIIHLDKAQVQGGFEIGAFRQVVEGYADAEELYWEYLKGPWAKVMFINSKESYQNYLRSMVGGRR